MQLVFRSKSDLAKCLENTILSSSSPTMDQLDRPDQSLKSSTSMNVTPQWAEEHVQNDNINNFSTSNSLNIGSASLPISDKKGQCSMNSDTVAGKVYPTRQKNQ